MHFISPHNSLGTCALQLLKLGGSSWLLDFISYNLSSFILNSALKKSEWDEVLLREEGLDLLWLKWFKIPQTGCFMKALGRLRYLLSIKRAAWFTLECFPCVSQLYNFASIPRRWAEANLWPNHIYFTTPCPFFIDCTSCRKGLLPSKKVDDYYRHRKECVCCCVLGCSYWPNTS